MAERFIGLMSGTSMDGVDGVLAEFEPGCRLLAHVHQPFPPELREQLMALQQSGPNEIEREALAAQSLTRLYARCVQQLLSQSAVPFDQVRAIGAHGQTIRHRPELGFTRQIQQPALLAELCQIDVIADFRSRDIAAGGQGAPLVPKFHHAIFARAGENRALVNIGGISNISLLHLDGRVEGCDTGPGNVLLDGWIGQAQGLPFDRDGAWGASGQVHPGLLNTLLAEPYLARAAPKSTGRDLFHMDWLRQQLAQHPNLPAADVQATLTAFTARSIADMLLRSSSGNSSGNSSSNSISSGWQALYVCGGGAYNGFLLRLLGDALPGVQIASSAELGVAPDQVEALAFAWLARCHVLRQSGNLPAVTGAAGERILGACYPGV
jgi:anhydro-N-acetylmuramic acid kinase